LREYLLRTRNLKLQVLLILNVHNEGLLLRRLATRLWVGGHIRHYTLRLKAMARWSAVMPRGVACLIGLRHQHDVRQNSVSRARSAHRDRERSGRSGAIGRWSRVGRSCRE